LGGTNAGGDLVGPGGPGTSTSTTTAAASLDFDELEVTLGDENASDVSGNLSGTDTGGDLVSPGALGWAGGGTTSTTATSLKSGGSECTGSDSGGNSESSGFNHVE
jgi:hypothetical protein